MGETFERVVHVKGLVSMAVRMCCLNRGELETTSTDFKMARPRSPDSWPYSILHTVYCTQLRAWIYLKAAMVRKAVS